MYIKLFKKEVEIWDNPDGDACYEIGVFIGWHYPILRLRMPNLSINQTPKNALFQLMHEYTLKDLEGDH